MTYSDPGICGADPSKYPYGTLIYVVVGAQLSIPSRCSIPSERKKSQARPSFMQVDVSSQNDRHSRSTLSSKTTARPPRGSRRLTSTSGWERSATTTTPSSSPAPTLVVTTTQQHWLQSHHRMRWLAWETTARVRRRVVWEAAVARSSVGGKGVARAPPARRNTTATMASRASMLYVPEAGRYGFD